MWTGEPADLVMTYDSWEVDGTYTLEVTVTDAAEQPVRLTRVTLAAGDDVYCIIPKTGDDGRGFFTGLPNFTDGVVTAWKHNFIPEIIEGVDVP